MCEIFLIPAFFAAVSMLASPTSTIHKILLVFAVLCNNFAEIIDETKNFLK